MQAEHRQHMMEVHKQEMEAMKADIEKLKASLAEMKANILTIREPNELSRWRNNVEMWETVITHIDRDTKEHGIDGTRHDARPGMSGSPPTPPSEKKPE